MSTLITAYKENTLSKIRMVCKNKLCSKAVVMDTASLGIIRAKDFDTYMFKCPHCSYILKVDFDYGEDENENSQMVVGPS